MPRGMLRKKCVESRKISVYYMIKNCAVSAGLLFCVDETGRGVWVKCSGSNLI